MKNQEKLIYFGRVSRVCNWPLHFTLGD